MDWKIARTSHHYRFLFSALAALVFFAVIGFSSHYAFAAGDDKPTNGRIITLHDHGVDKGFITKKATLREALAEQKIYIDKLDRTEPGLDEKLAANSYQVNVYRARQVIVRDGDKETKVITSYRTPKQIAAQAKIALYDEDEVKLAPSSDPIADGVAEVMTISRSTPFTFNFYGKEQTARTMARTVGDMLKEKGIKMESVDGIIPSVDTPIAATTSVKLWRNGVQTVTQEEDVAFTTKQVFNADQPVGYKKVETPGENGKRTATYEINMQNGVEVSRKEINSVTTKQPSEQVETVGTKPNGNGLTKAKGVMMFTDSKGVVHRETYYDLPMNRVMQNCGMGGYYTVRADGAKVDRDGYVIIAAHLGNYPRCSVVETSIGAGKVYDTGGFAARHPHGFDLATDWTKADGI
ncbi:MAG: G5 domain-containing protein [Acidobacteriota bacterium]